MKTLTTGSAVHIVILTPTRSTIRWGLDPAIYVGTSQLACLVAALADEIIRYADVPAPAAHRADLDLLAKMQAVVANACRQPGDPASSEYASIAGALPLVHLLTSELMYLVEQRTETMVSLEAA